MSRTPSSSDWISVAAPPAAYTIVLLSFADGSVRRGVWNGKLWWGYDERLKRACELHPLRWRIWIETASMITNDEEPYPARTISRAQPSK